MAKRVFLHIGAMKSATSYLQSLCQLNRGQLEDNGVLWPGMRSNFASARDLFGSGREPGDEGSWRSLSAEVAQFDGDALVSNELLAKQPARRAKQLVKALSPAEVHVVLTARDLGRVIPSMWQTHMRNRGTVSWGDFVDAVCSEDTSSSDTAVRFRKSQDLDDIIDRWSRAVPPHRITLVTVPPPGADPTEVAERFLSVVAPHVGELQQPSKLNESLGAHSAELLRRINLATTDWDYVHYRPALKNEVGRAILGERAGSEPRLGLTAVQLQRATARARAMVEAVRGRGVRVVGDLDDLIPSSSLQHTDVDPDKSTDGELLQAATYALAQLSRSYADLVLEQERRRRHS